MDGKESAINGSFAVTVTSYKPPYPHVTSGAHNKTGLREKLALVIPSLREVRNLAPLLDRVRAVLAAAAIEWEVIVVDDDSRDGTEMVVGSISQQDPRVRLLVRPGERGLSGAILHGWRHTDATILGAMDADGQHPPELLPQLIASLTEGHDLAIASRYADGGRRPANPLRRLASLAATLAARPLQSVGPGVRDPLSGFFLVRRDSVQHVSFQPSGFKLLLEILVRARIARVQEIPFTFDCRRFGRSKISASVAWDFVVLLARLYRLRFSVADSGVRQVSPASADDPCEHG
jgi:dolichol-phosphate mannosyltransferase